MDNKSKNTIIISIVALAIVLITVTYAYFSARITGLESASTISLTAGRLTIVYTEDPHINMNNIYPRDEAWVTKTFQLVGNNTTSLVMTYSVGLEIESNTFSAGALTYDLTVISATTGTPIPAQTGVPINQSGTNWLGVGSYTTGDNQLHSYELKIYFKDTGEDQNDDQGAIFNAKITMSGDVEITPSGWNDAPSGTLIHAVRRSQRSAPAGLPPLTNPGQEYSAVVYEDPVLTISDEIQTLTDTQLSETVMLSGREEYKYSLEYAETYDDIVNGENITYIDDIDTYDSDYSLLPNKYLLICTKNRVGYSIRISCPDTVYYVRSATSSLLTYSKATEETPIDYRASEAVLASAPDDYGTSFYYRGVVENNYVVFANMCWRIVRIDGAGNTKLVLYNYNPNSVSNPCASSEDGETYAFARYNNEYQSAFNTNYYKNTYIGYMYSSNPDSNDFDTAHANDNDSAILTFLKGWYDEKLRSYNDMLADVIWCNDKSIVTDTTYDPWENNNTIGTGLGTANTYYQATYRLNPVNSAAPSLICPSAGSDGKLSKFTARDSVNGNAKLYSDNKEYKIGLLTADEIAFAGSKMYEENDEGNTTYYLYNNTGGDIFYWTLSPSAYYGGGLIWVFDDYGNLQNIFVDDYNAAVRPAIALKSTVNVNASGSGTSSDPFVVN